MGQMPAGGGIKNTEAEIRDGVVNDATKFAGANIDAKISEAGVDPAIVRREARAQGFSTTLINSQPREIITSTIGSGEILWTSSGASVSAGVTSGDAAKLRALNALYLGGVELLKATVIFIPYDTPPFTDDAEIGWLTTNVGGTSGAYLDLTSGEYIAGASSSAATLPAAEEISILAIEIDFNAGETRFKQRGSVTEDVTIAEVSLPNQGLCIMNSNTIGETIYVMYASYIVIGEK